MCHIRQAASWSDTLEVNDYSYAHTSTLMPRFLERQFHYHQRLDSSDILSAFDAMQYNNKGGCPVQRSAHTSTAVLFLLFQLETNVVFVLECVCVWWLSCTF